MTSTPDTIADDVLRGAKEIGDFIGETPTRVFYLAEKRRLPIFRIGRHLRARKSELSKAYSVEPVEA